MEKVDATVIGAGGFEPEQRGDPRRGLLFSLRKQLFTLL